jgi:hypothetical protein
VSDPSFPFLCYSHPQDTPLRGGSMTRLPTHGRHGATPADKEVLQRDGRAAPPRGQACQRGATRMGRGTSRAVLGATAMPCGGMGDRWCHGRYPCGQASPLTRSGRSVARIASADWCALAPRRRRCRHRCHAGACMPARHGPVVQGPTTTIRGASCHDAHQRRTRAAQSAVRRIL